MKVLVAENNPVNMKLLCDILEKEGYKTIKAVNGKEALALYRQHDPDFICLDINMEESSGYSVCSEIRKSDTETPIVFISSKSSEESKKLGFDVGADDFIVKPYEPKEVAIRIRSVARRCIARDTPQKRNDTFILRHVVVYPQQLRAECGEDSTAGVAMSTSTDLSLREVKILQLFHDNKGKVITTAMLLDYCWGSSSTTDDKMVDRHIEQLRKKIEIDPAALAIIRTVPGSGYKFE